MKKIDPFLTTIDLKIQFAKIIPPFFVLFAQSRAAAEFCSAAALVCLLSYCFPLCSRRYCVGEQPTVCLK